MSFAGRMTDFAAAVRDKFNLVTPRLLPAGGTTGQVLSKIDGTAYNAQWSTPGRGGSPYIQHFIPLAAGTLIDAAINALSQTTQAGATNRCDFVPFMPSRDITVATMQGEVTTGVASSNFLLGIYDDNNGVPGNKLVESAALSGVTVQVLLHTIPGGFTFQAGTLYWLAFLSSSTTTFRALSVGGMYSMALAASTGTHANIRRATAVSFALPATAMNTSLTSATTPQMRFTTA